MANIKDKLNNIKNALFGHEVRESIHDGIEAINEEVENTTSRQNILENTFEQLTINSGNSNAEIVDARVEADGTSHKKLGDRLNKVDSQIKDIDNQKVNKNSLYINVEDFGGSSLNTNEENKIALQNALKYADENGCGVVFIPPNICYGYHRNKVETHPNFENIKSRIMVIDYSKGTTYDHLPAPNRDGSQMRYFFNTEGTEDDAKHDGNGIFVRGKWHPYIMISNDGVNTNNRRATYFIANKGVATWGIGQGVNTIEGGSDDELSHFKIMGNKVKGSEGFTTCYCIDKVTGMMGWNNNAPSNDFDFKGRNNGVMRLKDENAKFTIQNNNMSFSLLPNKTQPLVQLQTENYGDILNIEKQGSYIQLRRRTDGNVSLILQHNDDSKRKIEYRDDTKALNFTNSGATSSVVVFSDSGNGYFKEGVSGNIFTSSNRPTGVSNGTMIFDSTLGKPIWHKGGGVWVDCNGQSV